MTLAEKLKLIFKLESTEKAVEEGIRMKNTTKVIGAIIGLITAVLQIPSIQAGIVHAINTHPALALALGGIGGILALLHVPTKTAETTVKVLLVALLLAPCAGLHAQTAPAADVQNLYAAGVSYSAGATPAIAGTGLYAHQMLTAGTYAFTALDAVPNTLRPFTVSTNVGAGVAQKVLTLAKYPVYIPTSAGISFTGQNTGFQWNTGAATVIPIKGGYFVMPTVRVLKSSVSGGTGYQPIIGVLFGWGK